MKGTADFSELMETPLFSLAEEKEPNGICTPIVKLDPEAAEYFRRRMEILVKRENPKGKLIFRGTNAETLSRSLCKIESHLKKIENSCIYENVFYFGDKAAYYLEENRKNAKKISPKILFNALNKQLSKKRQEERAEISVFCTNEEDVYDFFSNEENKIKFSQALSKNPDFLHFYQALSHTLGCIANNPSKHKSTTINLQVAKKFAMQDRDGKKSETPIVLLYALPEIMGNIKFSVNSFFTHNAEFHRKIITLLQDNALPFCKSSYCYEAQKEITIYGALMPHLIWGIYEINNHRIIVNPAMFNKESRIRATTSLWLSIPQQNFDKLCKIFTPYWNYISYDCQEGMQDGPGFEHSKNNI